MAETLTKVVVNCETGVQEILPLTAEEIADRETAAAAYAAAEAAAAAKASGLAKLLALGLTEDEANALVK